MQYRYLIAFLAGLSFGGPVLADDTGQAEYMNTCAACHGESGKGDGPLSGFLNVKLNDLTTIAKRTTDGQFPFLDVMRTIDGRAGDRGHGFPMPVWGDRFTAEVGNAAGPYGAELLVRGRILSIVYYLESIQE